MTLKSDKLTEIISQFVDKNFPKGKEDRGFVILVLASFLIEFENNKKWKIVKKKVLPKK